VPNSIGQLVFFPPPFAIQIAELVAGLRKQYRRSYDSFIGRKMKPKLTEEEVEISISLKRWPSLASR